MNDRVTEGTTVHVLARGVENVLGAVLNSAQPRIAAQVKSHAMPFVGSRFRCNVDRPAGAMPSLGLHAIDGDDAFLNVVRVRDVSNFLPDSERNTVQLKLI